jgi:ABC-type Fe3+-hydroxamate transport system substrate-binding protein
VSRRVVSLVPSITESLLAWGVRPIAVTRFCEAEGIETVGGTKNPDIDAILRLDPDVVLMDEEENRRADASALSEAGVQVVATAVRSLGGVGPALARVADAVGVVAPEPPPVPLPVEGRRPAIFVPIWRRPWMTIGGSTYGSSLLTAAGFDNVFGDSADAYPTLELADVAAMEPDRVLAPSEPYAFGERHRPELEAVAPVVFVDGKDLFWWGSRTGGALGRLRSLAAELGRP